MFQAVEVVNALFGGGKFGVALVGLVLLDNEPFGTGFFAGFYYGGMSCTPYPTGLKLKSSSEAASVSSSKPMRS